MKVIPKKPGPQRWEGVIGKTGINPYVDVPKRVSTAYGVKGCVPVVVAIGEGRIATTLVPIGEGRHRLYVNAAMLKAGKAAVGDRLAVALTTDRVSRMPPVPKRFAAGLAAASAARRAWTNLPPSRQKEVLRYLNFAKTEETLARNVAKALMILSNPNSDERLAGIRIHGVR